MAETAYGPYTISTLPQGNGLQVGKLLEEIHQSSITIQVASINQAGDQVTVTFKDVLPQADKTALDGGLDQNVNDPPTGGSVLGQHDGTPISEVTKVEVTNQPNVREDNTLYAVPKPGGLGLYMCDRDFRLNTGVVANTFEDLYVSTATKLETSWQELSFGGCFKNVAGSMVECVDQADADENAVLSIFDYVARAPGGGDPIAYELRDGTLYADPRIFANPANPTPGERFAHRAYAVLAPDIPGAFGGSVAFFDGYLAGNTKSMRLEATSPQTQVLDPNGPGGAAGVVLRLYLFYPAGSKLNHVLRLVTYRAPGTFA